ncbi:MAG: phosphate acyltransferase [Paracoccaceae bacterium]
MSVVEAAFEIARAKRARVVFPEWDDPRIIAAVERLRVEGLADPIPLSDPTDAHITAIQSVRPVKEAVARRMLAKPLYRAAAMVACGQATAMVAGANAPTRRVIEAASIVFGMADNITTPSSFFLMIFPNNRSLIFADCAVNVAPDASQLSDIARSSAISAKALLGQANLAMLSFSTLASGTGTSVDAVRQATETLAAEGHKTVGPVQADAALNATIAAAKGITTTDTNTLIFPNLDAGNIAYKLCQELAGAQAIGPFLQGFRHPVCDLSRGATVDDIVAATVITIAMA